jgi:DNA mismatch endonuclease (patch repair protein)
MPDTISPEGRSRIMRAIRAKNTKPETTVRKYLFSAGYRDRIHSPHLPGKPDLEFARRRKIFLVHGCFWHQHSEATCTISGTPASNRSYWGPKMRKNLARDRRNLKLLQRLGFKVLIVWECELRANAERVCRKIKKFLGPTKWPNPG